MCPLLNGTLQVKRTKSMKLTTDMKEKLQYYINNNEVVCQFRSELVEASNETTQENKNAGPDYFNRVKPIEVYGKHHSFTRDNWSELTDWVTNDDFLFLLDCVGMMIRTPKKEVLTNNILAA